MSDRIIRDELLTSERYWAVSNEAKLLYLHLILNVDDTARFSGKNFTLRASCFPSQPMEAVHMERMLDELQTQDLIRLYMVDNERYVFIPRFKQRLRFVNSKFPTPPNEINDLVIKKSDSSQTKDSPKTGSRPPKLREEKLREEKITTLSGKPDSSAAKDILEHLNKKTGRQYHPVAANLHMINARIKEFSVEDCIAVIDMKVSEWSDNEQMNKYLRPATLFSAKNFASYQGMIGQSSMKLSPNFWMER